MKALLVNDRELREADIREWKDRIKHCLCLFSCHYFYTSSRSRFNNVIVIHDILDFGISTNIRYRFSLFHVICDTHPSFEIGSRNVKAPLVPDSVWQCGWSVQIRFTARREPFYLGYSSREMWIIFFYAKQRRSFSRNVVKSSSPSLYSFSKRVDFYVFIKPPVFIDLPLYGFTCASLLTAIELSFARLNFPTFQVHLAIFPPDPIVFERPLLNLHSGREYQK